MNAEYWEAEIEMAVKVLLDGDRDGFASDMRRLGFDDGEIAEWIAREGGR